jgi:pyruvate-formate lyase-activating enzyme
MNLPSRTEHSNHGIAFSHYRALFANIGSIVINPPLTRALFVSPVQPIGGCSPNVYSWDKRPAHIRVAMSFLNHPGLCFLRANAPCKILEYPSNDDFEAALVDPPEVLGISFHINETEIALDMAARARRAGVGEIWAGNYGAYSPQVGRFFNRVFTGWGEHEVAAALGAPPKSQAELRHPEMYGAIGTNVFPRMVLSGLLYTSRGCPWSCNFCQTPDFYGKAAQVPLQTIDEILWTYRRRGITGINILDENFGTFSSHSLEVAELLHRHKMRWIALTRVDTLLRHFDRWASRGLFGAHLGIESLNQKSLTGASKKVSHLDSIRLVKEMSHRNMFVQAFYILGFEQDTVESIREDVAKLAELDLDVVQVQVLTPYPRTGQRDAIEEQYGIADGNLSKYNSRHLVWNHPHIQPGQMRELQLWANSKLASSRRALRTLAKFALYCGQSKPNLAGAKLLLDTARGPGRKLHSEFSGRITAARRWARTGWYPYEEVGDSGLRVPTEHRARPLPVVADVSTENGRTPSSLKLLRIDTSRDAGR